MLATVGVGCSFPARWAAATSAVTFAPPMKMSRTSRAPLRGTRGAATETGSGAADPRVPDAEALGGGEVASSGEGATKISKLRIVSLRIPLGGGEAGVCGSSAASRERILGRGRHGDVVFGGRWRRLDNESARW